MTKALKKIGLISIVFKFRFALYSTHDNMMQGSWGIYVGFSEHEAYLSDLKNNVNREMERMSLLSPQGGANFLPRASGHLAFMRIL